MPLASNLSTVVLVLVLALAFAGASIVALVGVTLIALAVELYFNLFPDE